MLTPTVQVYIPILAIKLDKDISSSPHYSLISQGLRQQSRTVYKCSLVCHSCPWPTARPHASPCPTHPVFLPFLFSIPFHTHVIVSLPYRVAFPSLPHSSLSVPLPASTRTTAATLCHTHVDAFPLPATLQSMHASILPRPCPSFLSSSHYNQLSLPLSLSHSFNHVSLPATAFSLPPLPATHQPLYPGLLATLTFLHLPLPPAPAPPPPAFLHGHSLGRGGNQAAAPEGKHEKATNACRIRDREPRASRGQKHVCCR